MLELLSEFEANTLPGLLQGLKLDAWNDLVVTYEEPRVDRLWQGIGDYRLCLHKIYPSTSESLYHPHPWPSAMRIVHGEYLMKVGTEHHWAEVRLSRGDAYVMEDPHLWHSVSPLYRPSYSFMLMGPKSENDPHDHGAFGKDQPTGRMTDDQKRLLLGVFHSYYLSYL